MGYNKYGWKQNKTIKYIQSHQIINSKDEIYSNEPFALYLLTDIYSQRSPKKIKLPNIEVNVSELKYIWPEHDNSYLIWFNDFRYLRNSLIKVEKLKTIANLKKIASFNDGTIYLVNKKKQAKLL